MERTPAGLGALSHSSKSGQAGTEAGSANRSLDPLTFLQHWGVAKRPRLPPFSGRQPRSAGRSDRGFLPQAFPPGRSEPAVLGSGNSGAGCPPGLSLSPSHSKASAKEPEAQPTPRSQTKHGVKMSQVTGWCGLQLRNCGFRRAPGPLLAPEHTRKQHHFRSCAFAFQPL